MSAQKNDNSAESEEGIKPSDYVRELLKEKLSLNPEQHGNAMRLLDQEVAKAQAQTGGKPYKPENRYVDIYKDKPVKVVAKVLVPVKEHPKFNFVGKLLGPKGNSLKRLQEETMTKMAILGRGSMRDKQKEEEFRNALDPKYAHLNDDLHVEIQVLASPGEAYARIAYALAEIRKYLIPDVNDEIRQEQLREIHQYSGAPRGARGGGPPGRSGPPPSRGPAAVRGSLRPPGVAPRAAALTNLAPPMPPRPMPGKTKVLSILDRARAAMEESYGGYDDGYFDPPAAMGYSTTGFGSGYNGSGFYDSGYAEGDNYGEKYDKYGASRADVDSDGDDVEDVGGGWKSYTPAKPEKSGGKMQSSRGFRPRGRGGRGGFGSPYQRPYSQQRQPKFIN